MDKKSADWLEQNLWDDWKDRTSWVNYIVATTRCTPLEIYCDNREYDNTSVQHVKNIQL